MYMRKTTMGTLYLGLMVAIAGSTGCAHMEAAWSGAASIGALFDGPKVEFSRPVPADQDLPEVKTIALGEIEGDGADKLASQLKQRLGESGRFKVLTQDKLASLAESAGCETDDAECLETVAPGL